MQSRNRHLFVTDLLQSRVLLMNGFPSYHLYALLARKSLAKDSSMNSDLCHEPQSDSLWKKPALYVSGVVA